MDISFFKKLYQYHDWANLQVIEAAAQLDEASYRKDFGQAWGSVHGTLAHLLDAEQIWFARWQGESPQHRPEGAAFHTLADIRAARATLEKDRITFLDSLSDGDLTRIFEYKNTKGDPFAHPLWWQLYHVVNHGTDHRGYLSVMLTELGHPPTSLDFIAYVRL